MRWINYHHLLYFWTVAREGSVTRAAGALHLTQPAISTQLRSLERSLGQRLFERRGRQLQLTDVGAVVFRYADEIFALGREMQQVLAGGVPGAARLVVGVADAMPKLLTWRLLAPAFEQDRHLQVVVREDPMDRLIADLAVHRLDLILSDAPAPAGLGIKAFSHPLGQSPVGIYAHPELARRYRRNFPRSLTGAPFLMPGASTTIKRSLDAWFSRLGVQPAIVAEIDDSALLKTFGQAGVGLFAAPIAITKDVERQFDVRLLGEVPHAQERYYAISAERKVTHPAVAAITRNARIDVFAR